LSPVARRGVRQQIGGFDDEISRDHNWRPRFFLFLSRRAITASPS